MQCERAQEFFSDYLERTLDRPMTVAVESHLGSCAACREEVEALRGILLALEAVPEVEPPWDGAWQVIRHIRAADAEREAARRPWTETFTHWLRALNPAGAAMAASLATLVVGGAVVGAGWPHIRNTFFPPPPAISGPVVGSPRMPVVRASYNPQTAQVLLRITPHGKLPGARARLDMGTAAVPIAGDQQDLGAGNEIVQPVILRPDGQREAEELWLTISQPSGLEYRYLVVVPLQQNAASKVTMMLEPRPINEVLRPLAKYLGRPVVVSGVTETSVSLGVNEESPVRCLHQIADQARAEVTEEPDAFRLTPRP